VKIGLVLNKRWVFMKKLLILDRMSRIKRVLPKSISCFDKPVLSEPEALPPGQKPLSPSWRTLRAGSWGGAWAGGWANHSPFESLRANGFFRMSWAKSKEGLMLRQAQQNGKSLWFQHNTARPEALEGQMVGLGNSLLIWLEIEANPRVTMPDWIALYENQRISCFSVQTVT